MSDLKLATIERVYLETESLGSWYFEGVILVKTMELPWKNNAHNISCIPESPAGRPYLCKKEAYTEKHPYPHFRITGVPDYDFKGRKERTGILVHLITYVSGLKGCVGVGNKFADLNKDEVPDMAESTLALNKLYATMPDEFLLEIKEKS